ncbi:hypothetical protein HK405_006976 [Cladochytrium tenue]|nr:hypothetical protein HK405_006976 [Cladochytrium tenue]
MWATNRWFSVRTDIISASFVFCAGAVVALLSDVPPGWAGVALLYAAQFSEAAVIMARCHAEMEMSLNAVERCCEYASVEQEPPRVVATYRPLPEWPESGGIEVKNLSIRYALDQPLVLNDISFSVRGGEKIGIVGRTGAGKSTLSLAFFRIVPHAAGTIFIDGMDINRMGLTDLRSKLTIIPQDPVLFKGTIRSNLDPLGDYDDAVLWDALRRSLLLGGEVNDDNGSESDDEDSGSDSSDSSAPSNTAPGTVSGVATASKELSSLTLDSTVLEGGANFSQGQRQQLCLARALLRRPRVLLLDEATASLDHATDARLQRAVRRELPDATLLCIAHRLRSVARFDRVAVLDAGRLVEFGDPADLLEREGGPFWRLCRDSGDDAALRRRAHAARAGRNRRAAAAAAATGRRRCGGQDGGCWGKFVAGGSGSACEDGVHNVIRHVPTPSAGPYAVVSHVWGPLKTLRPRSIFGGIGCRCRALLRSDAKARRLEQMLAASSLPVWIDILSIDQSKPESIASHLKVMDRIYGLSDVCYVLCDDRLWACLVELKDLLGSDAAAATDGSFWSEAGLSDVRSLCERIKATEYFSRVWTFQELMLSRNVVFVSPVGYAPANSIERKALRMRLDQIWSTSGDRKRVEVARKEILALIGSDKPSRIPLSTTLHNISSRECSEPHDRLFGAAAVLGVTEKLEYMKKPDEGFLHNTKLHVGALLFASGFINGAYGMTEARKTDAAGVVGGATRTYLHTFCSSRILAAEDWPALAAATLELIQACSRQRSSATKDSPLAWRTPIIPDSSMSATHVLVPVQFPAVVSTQTLRVLLARELSHAGVAVSPGPDLDHMFRDSPPTLELIRLPPDHNEEGSQNNNARMTAKEGKRSGSQGTYFTHHAILGDVCFSWGGQTNGAVASDKADQLSQDVALAVVASSAPVRLRLHHQPTPSPAASGSTSTRSSPVPPGLTGTRGRATYTVDSPAAGPFVGRCTQIVVVADAMRPYEITDPQRFVGIFRRVFALAREQASSRRYDGRGNFAEDDTGDGGGESEPWPIVTAVC